MREAQAKFIREDALLWRILYRITALFITKRLSARDARGRSRSQIAAELVDEGIGPNASVSGRDHAVELLTVAPLVVFGAGFALQLPITLLLRPTVGDMAAGNILAVGSGILFPVLGVVFPMSIRFWRARQQLRGWRSRAEPPDETPVDGSLPGKVDLAVGAAIGSVFSILLIVGVLA